MKGGDLDKGIIWAGLEVIRVFQVGIQARRSGNSELVENSLQKVLEIYNQVT